MRLALTFFAFTTLITMIEAAEPEQLPVGAARVYRLRTTDASFDGINEGVQIAQPQTFESAAETAVAYEIIERGDIEAIQARDNLLILAVGPILDSPDKVTVKELRRDGTTLELKIVHTNVRKQGVQLRRNCIWRPIVALPYSTKMTDQVIKVAWIALESVPDGKPLEAEPVVVRQNITLSVPD